MKGANSWQRTALRLVNTIHREMQNRPIHREVWQLRRCLCGAHVPEFARENGLYEIDDFVTGYNVKDWTGCYSSLVNILTAIYWDN